MIDLLHRFEKVITYTLLIVGMFFIVYQTLALVYELYFLVKESVAQQRFFPEIEGRTLGAVFFSILLTLEIVETVKVFNQTHLVKIRIILLVGLIAVTRKILLLDATHGTPESEWAAAGLIFALSLSYFLVSRGNIADKWLKKSEPSESNDPS